MASTGRRAEGDGRAPSPAFPGIRSSYPTLRIARPGLPPAVVVQMPHTHSAVVEVFVRAGSAYETRDNNGISHFLEHVVLAGSDRHPTRPVLQRAIDATGGFLDAVTHQELTEFTFQVLPEQVGAAIDLLGESLARASFSEAAVESERQIVLEEMITGNYEGAKDPFTEILWGTDSVGLPIIGSREVVQGLRAEDLRSFWRRRYSREHLLVCVAGQADPRAIEASLQAFAGMAAGEPDAGPRAPGGPRDEPVFHFERYSSESIDACIMFRTPGWASAEPELHTLLYLVTQYYQTHVYQALIGPELPVYYLYAGQETFVPEGYIYFYFNVARERFFPTLERVLEEIERLRDEGIPADELEGAKRRYALSVLSNLDDPRDVAYRVGSDLLLCGPDRAVSIEQELEQIRAITPARIDAVLERTLAPRNLCVVARGGLGWWSQRRLRRRLDAWMRE